MKILFLDFDGVLNSGDGYRSFPPETRRAGQRVSTSAGLLDPEAVALLDEVLAATGASVVVSSTWRLSRTSDELQEVLEERGFRGEIAGVTPYLDGLPRGDEIAMWLAENAGEGCVFAIVDDCDDMGDLLPRLVRTDPERGLTKRECARLVELLGRD